MRNTSESPDTNEPTKTTPARTRSTTRSKSESATPGNTSPEQETRPTPAPRRRATPTPTNTVTTTSPTTGEGEQATTPSQVVARPTTQRTGNPTTGSVSSAQRMNSPTAGSAPAGSVPPAQRPRTANTTTPRPTSAPNPAGQRPAGTGTFSQQRPGGTGVPLQQRPGGTGTPLQRPSGTGTTAPRQSQGATQYRPGSGGQNHSGTAMHNSANSAVQSRPAPRPNNGTSTAQSGTARPTSTTRSTTNRPGTPGHYGQGQGHTGNTATRSPGRPAAPAQRPQERRVPVVKEKPTGPISIPPQIVVKDLAELLHATPNEVIRGLIKLSIFASINQVVEYEKAALVAKELGFEPSLSTLTAAPAIQSSGGLSANEAMIASRNEDNMVIIPPVVTIMGHVDHGKTSLLDTIRKTKVAAGEAGGITQHIGAYQIETNGKKITFLDTPGHEAFTAMRARGAQVTHIAIIVVAADDGVMPQTREAIDHAQAAKVPIIIALNKIDKAGANPDHVKQQLAEIGIVIEEYGGDVVCVPVSARKGTGIDDLLEMILLVAEVQDIKANPNRLATGVIIEAKLEKNTGPMATILIQQGTLKMGDNIVVGPMAGKIRAMFNDRGKRIQKAPPSTPVSILGLPEVPNAGDRLEVVADDRTAKQLATKAAEQRRSESMPLGQVSLDTLYMQMQEGTVKELNVVLKCDVQGSAEAIKNALTKVGEENIKVRLIHEGIGNISETDVHLAAASGAVIIGFNVKADGAAQRQAQKEGVDIRYYNVIYKLTDDIQAALTGMLEPTFREVVEGHAEVVQIFKAGKNTVIAGCRVTDGKITRSSQARIMRKTEKAFEGKIGSLRRGKDDVREVASGYECGIVMEDFTEFEIGDIIEAFSQERVKPGA